LNETYGIELEEDEEGDFKKIVTNYEDNEELKSVISLFTLLFFTIENKYFMSDIKTDTVKIVDKKYHVLSRTMDGQNYEKSTEYWVRFSNQDINNIRISGINSYRPGTEIEISYRKSGLTNSIKLIEFNFNADSDKNTRWCI